MARRQPNTSPPRIVDLGDRRVRVFGLERRPVGDLYHWFLTMSWPRFLLVGVAVYIGVNLLFAGLYWLDPNAISGARPRSFVDDFFFSVQTFGTIGYGVLAPKSVWANLLVTAEAFMSLAITAVATGLIFARFSRPTARVMFSRFAVIAPYEGAPTLMFRAANERANQVLQADVSVTLARQVTSEEGVTLRRLHEIHVIRSRQPLFALSWTIMHRIDDSSPLHGATPESLKRDQAEIVVVLSGVDETFAQRIHTRHAYAPDDIMWGRHFADILSVDPDGLRSVDYRRFHDVRDLGG